MKPVNKEIVRGELAVVRGQVSKAVSAAELLTIKTKEDMPVAVELLSKIKQVGKVIKEKKEGITKPMNEALKNARDLFRPLEESWNHAELTVKLKMIEYSNEVDRKQKEEEAKITKKVEAGKMSFETAAKKMEAIEKVETVSSKSGTAEFRTHKLVVVESPSLVPDEYWEINTVKLRADLLAGVVVPGAKIVEEKIVAGYSKDTEEYAGSLAKK